MPMSALSALPSPVTGPTTSALSAAFTGKQSSRPSAVRPTAFRFLMRALRPLPVLLTQLRAASASLPPSNIPTRPSNAMRRSADVPLPQFMMRFSLPDRGPAPGVGTLSYGASDPDRMGVPRARSRCASPARRTLLMLLRQHVDVLGGESQPLTPRAEAGRQTHDRISGALEVEVGDGLESRRDGEQPLFAEWRCSQNGADREQETLSCVRKPMLKAISVSPIESNGVGLVCTRTSHCENCSSRTCWRRMTFARWPFR